MRTYDDVTKSQSVSDDSTGVDDMVKAVLEVIKSWEKNNEI